VRGFSLKGEVGAEVFVLLRRPRPLPVMEVDEADEGRLALVVPPVGDVTLALPSCPDSALSNLEERILLHQSVSKEASLQKSKANVNCKQICCLFRPPENLLSIHIGFVSETFRGHVGKL